MFIGNKSVGKRTIINLLLELKSLPITSNNSIESIIKKGKLVTPTGIYNALLISTTPDLVSSGKHNSFIQNSNLIIFVVTKFRDMLACKKLVNTLKELSPYTGFCVIANKQDLEDTLNPTAAMKFFDLPTIGISAIITEHREALLNFISEFLK